MGRARGASFLQGQSHETLAWVLTDAVLSERLLVARGCSPGPSCSKSGYLYPADKMYPQPIHFIRWMKRLSAL